MTLFPQVSPVGEIGVSTKKATQLDQSTITGLIVIAVVCCVVGTSLVWVVIIYKTRRRQNGPDDNGDTTTPLNGGVKQGDSTHKIGDSVSNSSSQTKSDSFLGMYRAHPLNSYIYSDCILPTVVLYFL